MKPTKSLTGNKSSKKKKKWKVGNVLVILNAFHRHVEKWTFGIIKKKKYKKITLYIFSFKKKCLYRTTIRFNNVYIFI